MIHGNCCILILMILRIIKIVFFFTVFFTSFMFDLTVSYRIYNITHVLVLQRKRF